MKLKLLYFAGLREKLGVSEEEVIVPDSVHTVADARNWLCARGDIWADALAPERNLRAAVQQRMSVVNTVLEEGNEVAFFPPVTGG